LGILGYLYLQYSRNNQEHLAITDQVRHSASGSFVKLSDGFTHYELAGPAEAARTVVFVHGFSVPYYLWDGIYQATAERGYRVLRYDLFGRGLSDRPNRENNSAFFDRQLVELLQALNLSSESVDMVGSSLGGPIVAQYACRHPDSVRTATFFGPGYSHGQPMPDKLKYPIWGEYTMAVQIAPHLPEAQRNDFLHPEKFPDWPNRYRRQMQYFGFRASLLSTLRNYLAEDWSKYYDCLGRQNVAVFLVWGKADRDMPFEVSKDVLKALPRAEFFAESNAAHVPFLETPEVVQPRFFDFLAKH
jgi:pimeloyl-ACP methyl ester carboxylesterase